jgi:hypothetical protein
MVGVGVDGAGVDVGENVPREILGQQLSKNVDW